MSGTINHSNASELIGENLIYRFFLQEINIRGEKTYLDFTIEDGIVT